MRVATQHPKYKGLVVMPDGTTETKAAAIEQGFTVSAMPPASVRPFCLTAAQPVSAQSVTLDAPTLYRMSIMALPEAKHRPAAAEQLAADHDATTLSPRAAAELLNGIPTESITAKEAVPMTTKLSAVDASRFRRLCEIRVCALRLNAARGNQKAAVEAKRLDHAMRVFDMGGITFSQAVEGSGLDVNHTLSKILNEKIKD